MTCNPSPKISVVVPVYNTERYLPTCIESILNQNYRNFELILIDDGSTDKSADIIHDFKSRGGGEIIVFHQPNKGVSAARNKGIEIARGELVCFCDSDDSVSSSWLQDFIDNYEKGISLLSQGYIELQEDKTATKKVILPAGDYTTSDYFNLSKGITLGYLWCKCFRKDIIAAHGIRFDESVSLCEDLLFSTEYILACDRIRNLAVANYSYWKQDYGKKYKAVDTFGSSLKLLELYPKLDIAPSSVHYVRIFDSLYHSLKGDIKGLRFRIFLQKIRRIKASRAYPLVHMSENKLRRIFCIL